MNRINTKKTVFVSLFWKLMERCVTQGASFVVSIVLARLLLPDEYGLISLLMVFISLANVMVQSGFSTALIQRKNVSDVDFSSVFYISLSLAGVLYIAIFYSSPLIAEYYGVSQLVPILRTLAITLFFGALSSIQVAIVSRNMCFRKLFYSSFYSIVLSGTIGIAMAYRGFGAWALVGQYIVNQISLVVILWFTVRWRPRLVFSITHSKEMLSYGWKILAANMINTLFLNSRSLVIGRVYSTDMLGYFNRGKQFPDIIITNINGSIQSVMLPTYSAEQDNIIRVKDMVRRSITMSSFLIFPMMVGLAVIAKPLVILALTDKWLPAVPFLQIFCASNMFSPIHTANIQALQGLGHTGKILKLEVARKCLELVTLIISMKYGIYAIALGTVLNSTVSLVINSYPNRELLNYRVDEQLKDVMPSLILSIIMGLVVYAIQLVGASLLVQVCTGAVLYLALAVMFRLETVYYLLSTYNEYFGARGMEAR